MCNFCPNTSNSKLQKVNIRLGESKPLKNCTVCQNCLEVLLRSGYSMCTFCGNGNPCFVRAKNLIKVWQYIPSTKSFELQNICKLAVEKGVAEKCPCCSRDILCSEEVLEKLGKCPDCYLNDLLYEEYCDYIEDLDALEHF